MDVFLEMVMCQMQGIEVLQNHGCLLLVWHVCCCEPFVALCLYQLVHLAWSVSWIYTSFRKMLCASHMISSICTGCKEFVCVAFRHCDSDLQRCDISFSLHTWPGMKCIAPSTHVWSMSPDVHVYAVHTFVLLLCIVDVEGSRVACAKADSCRAILWSPSHAQCRSWVCSLAIFAAELMTCPCIILRIASCNFQYRFGGVLICSRKVQIHMFVLQHVDHWHVPFKEGSCLRLHLFETHVGNSADQCWHIVHIRESGLKVDAIHTIVCICFGHVCVWQSIQAYGSIAHIKHVKPPQLDPDQRRILASAFASSIANVSVNMCTEITFRNEILSIVSTNVVRHDLFSSCARMPNAVEGAYTWSFEMMRCSDKAMASNSNKLCIGSTLGAYCSLASMLRFGLALALMSRSSFVLFWDGLTVTAPRSNSSAMACMFRSFWCHSDNRYADIVRLIVVPRRLS